MSYRDQALLDIEARAGYPAPPTLAERIFAGPPALIDDLTDVRWRSLSAGLCSLLRPLQFFAVRSIRFSVRIDAGAVGAVVPFTFAGYAIRPQVADGLADADTTPEPAVLSAFLLPGFTKTFHGTRSAGDTIRHVELFFPVLQKLGAGVWYAFVIIPETSGASVFCPSSAHGAYTPLSVGTHGEPPLTLQLTADVEAGPSMEFRDDMATRLLTGGAEYRRF